jgi:hypothetical protein
LGVSQRRSVGHTDGGEGNECGSRCEMHDTESCGFVVVFREKGTEKKQSSPKSKETLKFKSDRWFEGFGRRVVIGLRILRTETEWVPV